MKQIFENIYLIATFLSISNQYLITFIDFCILINTGLKSKSLNNLSSIRKLGYISPYLKFIFITHTDGGHVGSLAALKRHNNAVVFSSQIENRAIEKEESSRPLKLKGINIFIFDKLALLFVAESAKIDEILASGQIFPEINQLRVIDSKGHTPGHYPFFWGLDRN